MDVTAPRHREYLAVSALSFVLVATVFLSTPLITTRAGFDADGSRYGTMAGSPLFPASRALDAPWCYRVLTPALVKALPVETLLGFRIVGFASNVVTLLILYLLLRKLRFRHTTSLTGVVLYAGVFWTLKFTAYSPAYVDHQTNLFWVGAIYLCISHRFSWLALVLGVGVLQKEVFLPLSLFGVAELWAYRAGLGRKLLWMKVAFLIGAPLITFIAVRAIIDGHSVSNFPENPLEALWKNINEVADRRFVPMFTQAVFSGLGITGVFVLAHSRRSLEYICTRPSWIVLLGVSTVFLFGGVDKARSFAYMLPLLVVLSVHALEASRLSLQRWYLTVALLLGTHLFIGGHFKEMSAVEDYLHEWVPRWAGWEFLPYLYRNLAVGLVFFVCQRWLGRQRSSIDTSDATS